MFRPLIASFLILLVACSGQPRIANITDPTAVIATRTVFVATNRAFEDQHFSAGRSDEVDYTRFDVSIPPDRELGEIPTARRQIDPQRHFGVASSGIYVNPSAFRGDLRRTLQGLPPEDREVVVFVHGYNNNFASGLYRIAQMAYDYEAPGVVTHFSWPSAGHPLGYVYDRESALFSREALEAFLRDVSAAGARRILLIGHSVGANLTMEVLRQIRISGDDAVLDHLSGVVLISPDIDIQVFQMQARAVEPLPQPFVILSSRQDRALQLSAGISGSQNRLGRLGTAEAVAEFEITLVDLSAFSAGSGDWSNHSTFATSPSLIQLMRGLPTLRAGQADSPIDLLTGTALTIRNATQILLLPGLQ